MIIKSLCSLTTGGLQAIETTDTEIKKDPITIVDFDDSMVNVGTLRKDTVIHHGYTFHNVGDKPLIVYYVSPDCNCTGYSISKKMALPGDSLTIDLTVDTKNKKNRFMLSTVVRMNTDKGLYVLRLEGNVASM